MALPLKWMSGKVAFRFMPIYARSQKANKGENKLLNCVLCLSKPSDMILRDIMAF